MQQNYLGKWTVVGVLIGVVAGLGATAFYYGIQLVTDLMLGGITGFFPPNPAGEIQSAVSAHPDFLLVPVATIIGGLIAGIVIFTLAPEAQGHGTDEAIAAFLAERRRARTWSRRRRLPSFGSGARLRQPDEPGWLLIAVSLGLVDKRPTVSGLGTG